MSLTTFVDTQFVVALINQRDQYHQRANELAAEFTGRSLLTTNLVLIETADALARNFRAQSVQVVDFFRRATNVEIVAVTSELFDAAFALYRERKDKTWGMTDCVSFVIMQRKGVQDVLTCDQHFAQAGFNALMRAKQ